MALLIYSDLHLEFGTDFMPPMNSHADVMILAGDIITFKKFEALGRFLEGWNKPVLYVAGNHEYYTKEAMDKGKLLLKSYLANYNYPNVTFLDDEAITIRDLNFFGGTMWTDFDNSNPIAMVTAAMQMNDYNLIKHKHSKNPLTPAHTVEFHKQYVQKLVEWFETPMPGARVVISHHAPVYNPDSNHYDSAVKAAYNSLDMVPIIKKYQPKLWIYGHTHEPDDQIIGKTRIMSNPRGYPLRGGGQECKGFDADGVGVIFF